MAHSDRLGMPLTAGDPAAVRHYDAALWNLLTLSGDPVADVDRALATDPGLVMGHYLKAALMLLATDRSLLPAAEEAIALARHHAGGASSGEKGHIAALEAFAAGRFQAAADRWEEVLLARPHDALAMYAAHQCDFFLGASSELRDRVARRLAALEPGWPGLGFYQGMHAFGLEEMNQYAEAEEAGRAAVAACRRDAWAIHAVAHVMEMTCRVEDGIDWLQQRTDDWASDSTFEVHNWWHLALYLLDRGRIPEVLALLDGKIKGGRSTAMLDMIDASALLWRLHLHGHDTGGRWAAVARVWEPRLEDGWYAFNDYHAMAALAAAGERTKAGRLLAAMERASAGETDNAAMTRSVGLPVARALLAFAEGRHDEAVDLLLPVRTGAAQAGGSHAQRDLVNQTLIRAAELAGRRELARALLSERLHQKPHSHLTRLWQKRLAA